MRAAGIDSLLGKLAGPGDRDDRCAVDSQLRKGTVQIPEQRSIQGDMGCLRRRAVYPRHTAFDVLRRAVTGRPGIEFFAPSPLKSRPPTRPTGCPGLQSVAGFAADHEPLGLAAGPGLRSSGYVTGGLRFPASPRSPGFSVPQGPVAIVLGRNLAPAERPLPVSGRGGGAAGRMTGSPAGNRCDGTPASTRRRSSTR